MKLRYEELIQKMTLEEKARLMSGKNVWETVGYEKYGIPSITMSDGPHGIRRQAGAGDHLGLNESLPATCFPTAATTANSWDEKLGEEIGEALGEEAAALGVCVVLGPGLNIKRSPLCGRNFEYFSEDPYLAGKMAASYIRGIQNQNIAACPKHFAANNQELRRMASNSVVDERTLREIYLTPFEIAVKEGKPRVIMSSYNEVNGIYANENAHLLQEILVDEWGFDGYVVSDWGGSNDHALGVKNGSHLEMPGTGTSGMKEILSAVESGIFPETTLNERVDELLHSIFRISSSFQKAKRDVYDVEGHHALARKAALESIVLLKNEDDILPLKAGRKIALIGDFAEEPRYQGAGSSLVNTSKPAECIRSLWKDENIAYARGYVRNRKTKEHLIKEAVNLAKKSDVVLVFGGLDEISESEGMDRTHMRMPQAQNDLIEAVCEVNSNVVVVLSAGSVVEMPWFEQVKGLVHGYLGGQAGASAMQKVLTGETCPSGKLNETYPYCYQDTPAYRYWPSKQRSSEYRESLYVGYRYYDTVGKDVRFPFGYGLSYTKFSYADLSVSEEGIAFQLKNIGTRDGAEIVQMYVGKESDGVFRPVKELKGFQKVFLKAGETQTVQIPFDDITFRFFDTRTNTWEVEGGSYHIYVGASVADIRLEGECHKMGSVTGGGYSREALPSYFDGDITDVGKEEYQVLYGKEIPDGRWGSEITANDAICQLCYGKSILGKLVCKAVQLIVKICEWRGKSSLNAMFIYHMPLRGLAKMTGGAFTMDMVNALVEMANGHRGKGVIHLIQSARQR